MDRYEDDGLHTCLLKFPDDGTPELQEKLQEEQTDIKYIKNVGNIYLLIGDKAKQITPILKSFQQTWNMEIISKHIFINQF